MAVAVLALVAYFLWSRRTPAEPGVAAPVATAPSSAAPVVSADGQLPPGVRNEDGILVDAEGRRVLNEAGLPIGPPIDPARWTVTAREEHRSADGLAFSFVTYERIK